MPGFAQLGAPQSRVTPVTYLDHAATTPMDPRVRDIFFDAVKRFSGNASSAHGSGAAASVALDTARDQLASFLNRTAPDVVFTAGASEALMIGIVGTCLALPPSRRHVLVGATEHKAVWSAVRFAQRVVPIVVKVLPVDRYGRLSLDALGAMLKGDVGLVIAMLANNETGSLTPIDHVVSQAHSAGALVMCDVTQAIGKIPLTSGCLMADMLVLSGHKFYGPKGVGALVASREVRRQLVTPLAAGGQESGLRGGTQNVPAIVGLGAAIDLVRAETGSDSTRLNILADLFASLLQGGVPGVRRLGAPGERIESVVALNVPGADAEEVLEALEHTEISSGSACNAGNPEPSHVLIAMGLTTAEASCCLRISLGRMTTETDVKAAAVDIASAVSLVRARNLIEV